MTTSLRNQSLKFVLGNILLICTYLPSFHVVHLNVETSEKVISLYLVGQEF